MRSTLALPRLLLAFAVMAPVTVGAPAHAQEGASGSAPSNEAIDTSKTHIELTLGYGITMSLAAHARDDERRQFTILSPRIGLMSKSVDVDPPLRGTFELLASVDLITQFSPGGSYAFGFGPIFRYDFWTGSRIVPFVDFGFGLAPNDFGHPEQGGHFAFELQGGAGAQVFVADGVALMFEYRFHHISSAFIYEPNYGINSSVFSFGTSIFF
ncbi:MAG TPA: acyloxyacyl hydrolase [Planctomycetota bacterium]|nr:acyloxyacyl hydrolase [Planctomycetota bacterium]